MSPDRASLFSGTEFTCGDGLRIPIAQVNDNYCDCADGGDEPGTSACSLVDQDTKAFYCPNVGHQPLNIFRSQVDDGLCDCCDGSDEAEGVCKNDCATAASKHAAEHAVREEKRKQGLVAKAELLAKARSIRDTKVTEIARMKESSATLDTEIARLLEVKKTEEALEVQEREAIHQASLAKKAEWELEKRQKPESGEEMPAPLACVSWRQTKDCKGDGEREESQDQPCDTPVDTGASGYCECEGVSVFRFDCQHASFNCTGVCFHRGVPPKEGDEEFKVDTGDSHERAEAKAAREQHSIKEGEKLELERKVAEYEAELKEEYGASDAFLALRNECFSRDSGEYTYTLCLFKHVQQKNRNSYSTSTLGNWKGFAEQTYSSWGGGKDFTRMIYDSGDHCWGGPVRSTNVQVVCGPTNEVLDNNEPSMCTYTMTFQTPAACEES
jgi:protein kinase C substrate 80K-H